MVVKAPCHHDARHKSGSLSIVECARQIGGVFTDGDFPPGGACTRHEELL